MRESAPIGTEPFDVGAVMDQVHFAYRPLDAPGRFEGGHSTYATEIDAASATVRAFSAPTDAAEPGDHALIEGAPLRLEVARIERGARVLARRGEGTALLAADGHLTITRAEVIEHYQNRDEGVEQSWAFEREPSGEGDLRVRVEASGLAYVGETASGLHFADPETRLGFRYGHGVWIDADGRETAAPARWIEGGIELVVPSDVVASSRYPAVLDPTISPEIGMDEPVLAPSVDVESVSVASDGQGFLVVWADWRGGASAISATRVTAAGEILDPVGLTIARPTTATTGVGSPSVASNGAGYLVTFVRGRSVIATRVSSGGVVLDVPELELTDFVYSAPRVASDGSGYLVVWRGGSYVRGARVSAVGEVDAPFSIPTGWDVAATPPGVASDGANYFVVWQEDVMSAAPSRVFGARVSATGVVLDPRGLRLWTAEYDQASPSVASNGSEYFVVWRTQRDPRVDIVGTRVSSAGEVLTPGALILGRATSASRPSVASDGSGYLVTHEGVTAADYDIRATRVTASGSVLDAGGLAICEAWGHQRAPVVASNGHGYFVAWLDYRRGGYSGGLYVRLPNICHRDRGLKPRTG